MVSNVSLNNKTPHRTTFLLIDDDEVLEADSGQLIKQLSSTEDLARNIRQAIPSVK